MKNFRTFLSCRIKIFGLLGGFLSLVILAQMTVHATTANPWPMYGHDERHTGYGSANGPNSVDLLWTYNLGVVAQDNASPVVGADGTIYVSSNGGLFAIDPDGNLKWKTTDEARTAPAIASDGTVYSADMWGTLYARDPATGNSIWSYPIGHTSYGSPTIGPDGTIYIGNWGTAPSTSKFFAINPNGSLKWVWDSGSTCAIESSAAIGLNGNIVFHHNCLGLIALDTDGQFQWAFAGLGQAWNSPSIGPDGTIYIGNSDYYFYAINPNGTLKWKAPVDNWMYESSSAISSDGSLIYRGDNGGKVYAFRGDGSIKWKRQIGTTQIYTAPLLSANNILYVTSFSSPPVLYALRAEDGEVLWSYSGLWSAPAMGSDGTLYVLGEGASRIGILHAFRCTDGVCSVPPTPTPTFTITPAPPIANNAYTSPYIIGSFPLSFTEDVRPATTDYLNDPALPCAYDHQKYHTVWFSFQPATDGILDLDTFNSGYDTILAVWTLTGLPYNDGWVSQACNDDSGGKQSSLQMTATAGQLYYIEVASYNYNPTNTTLVLHGDFTGEMASATPTATATATPTQTPTIKVLTLYSGGIQDGWILESTETSNAGGTMNATATTFNLGDGTADKQYRSILSFNTASLPDTAVITKVTLKIRVYGALVGNNSPFTWGNGLRVDVCKNKFGTTAALQLTDFNFNNTTNCKLLAGTFGSTPTSGWYSVNLISTARSKINKTGLTQFRLRFYKDDNDDGAADYWRFSSGNYATASLRPTLIVEYYVP